MKYILFLSLFLFGCRQSDSNALKSDCQCYTIYSCEEFHLEDVCLSDSIYYHTIDYGLMVEKYSITPEGLIIVKERDTLNIRLSNGSLVHNSAKYTIEEIDGVGYCGFHSGTLSSDSLQILGSIVHDRFWKGRAEYCGYEVFDDSSE